MSSRLFSLVASLALVYCGCAQATPLLRPRAAGAVSANGAAVTVASSGAYLRVNSVVYSDGSSGLIGGYADTSGSDKILRVVQSNNTGQSWDVVGSVASGPTATQELDNAFVLQIEARGRILYAFRNHDKDSATGDYTYYRLTVSYSDDFGATWSYLSQVSERAATATNNGLWEPFLRLASDGTTIQCYYSSEDAADDQNNFMKYSTDGGSTWSDEVAVSGQDVISRDGMTGVAVVSGETLMSVPHALPSYYYLALHSEQPTGTRQVLDLLTSQRYYRCVFENTEDGPFSIRYVLSYDDGMTWNKSTRNILYDPSNSVSTAQAPSVINVAGTLVASFMTNEDTPSDTDGDADGGTFKLVTASASSSPELVWADKTSISTEAHWPGLHALEGTDFLALYGSDAIGLASREYTVSS